MVLPLLRMRPADWWLADRETEGVITAEFDLDAIAQKRREWGVFRDRRPEMYGTLLTHGC